MLYGLTVRSIHLDVAWVVIVTNAIAGLWALAAHWRSELRHRALWWFTALAQVCVVVEIVLGVWLVAVEDMVAPELHVLYGFSGLVAIGIVYSYRHQLRQKIYVLYGCGGLFLMGLGLRAVYLA